MRRRGKEEEETEEEMRIGRGGEEEETRRGIEERRRGRRVTSDKISLRHRHYFIIVPIRCARMTSLTDCSAAFDASLDERHGTFPAVGGKDIVPSQRVDEDEDEMVEGRALPIPKMVVIRRRAFSRGDLDRRV